MVVRGSALSEIADALPASAPDPLRAKAPHPASHTLTVPAAKLLQDWKEAHARALAYLDALGIPSDSQAALVSRAIEVAVNTEPWADDSHATAETLAALRSILTERYPLAGPRVSDGEPFEHWRLGAFLVPPVDEASRSVAQSALPDPFSTHPPVRRRSMVPEKIERRFFHRLFNRLTGTRARPGASAQPSPREQRRSLPWVRIAHRRRFFFTILVLIPSIVASGFMVNVLPRQGSTWLEAAIVFFFGALFGWISIGFWTALLGFFTLLNRPDRFAITRLEPEDGMPFVPAGRTAIVMPICEEPVGRVFAGLRAIHDSLQRVDALPFFDFFILSDSYNPSTYLQEEEAWARWCRSVGGAGRIHYRRRKIRLERKAGNVADFCRRWGEQYRFMIMLDADSIMTGETLVRLVRMMERHPNVGMIQTAPTAVNRRSLFARVQQFSSRAYGRMFAAGLHFWQLGDGQYWGHNTIIRVKPFADHCALPRLPGKPPLGGEIMSHDFVEAALMGRAGWSLWLAYDLDGSYEEVPNTLLDEMNRHRRWCQGNLQHMRLLFTEGLFGAHRALFLNGALSYMSALLWFGFLTLSTVAAVVNAVREPDYFPHGASLFPEWPIWRPDWAIALLAVTGMILFLPKVLSILMITLKDRSSREYGGAARLILSVVCEILISSLLAPISMVFHSRFVVMNLLGRTVSWKSQGREDNETSWREAINQHGFDSLFASAWGVALFWLNPGYFWWVTPIIGALMLSVPVSVLSSRVSWGDRARRWKLFMIPEESNPPPELRDLQRNLDDAEAAELQLPAVEQDSFVRVAADPYANALHRAIAGRRRQLRPSIRADRAATLERALAHGPSVLTVRERKILLLDPDLVTTLHERVWALPDRARAALWGRPGQTKG
jgi:membrane glycosyltransferase